MRRQVSRRVLSSRRARVSSAGHHRYSWSPTRSSSPPSQRSCRSVTQVFPGRELGSSHRFEERNLSRRTLAVLCDDPGVSALVVDRGSGEALSIDPDSSIVLVNSSLATLIACSTAFQRHTADAHRADSGRRASAGESLLPEFRRIDPASVDGESQLWAIAAEELGYGLSGPAFRPTRGAQWSLLTAVSTTTESGRDRHFSPITDTLDGRVS